MSSTRINETGSKVEYECGCTMQRASFHDLWEREYICGVHKSTITLPPAPDVHAHPARFKEEPIADKVWKLADPAYTPEPLTTVVNPFTDDERGVLLTLAVIRQYQAVKEQRDVQRYYIEGAVKDLRLKALAGEIDALSSAMKKLTC